MKLSIFLPGIRPHTWLELYQSIPNTTALPKEEYELVIVSPCDLPPELQNIDNVRIIKDWGCPSRCNQLGILHSQGEHVVWGADGGVFSPTMAIDKAFAARPDHHKGIVSLRYIEPGVPNQDALYWWKMAHHRILRNAPYIPNDYYVVMQGLMSRDYLMGIGGWDCQFEHTGLGTVDLAVRLQNDGAEVVLGENLQHYTPHASGVQRPIKAAHRQDKTTLAKIYTNPISHKRTNINFDNWKDSPPVWARRFG